MVDVKTWFAMQRLKLVAWDNKKKFDEHWYAQLRHPIYYGKQALRWRIDRLRRKLPWLNHAIFKVQITICNWTHHNFKKEEVKYTSMTAIRCKRCGLYKSDRAPHAPYVMTHLSGDWSAHKCDIKGRPQ